MGKSEKFKPIKGYEKKYEIGESRTIISCKKSWENGSGGIVKKDRSVLKTFKKSGRENQEIAFLFRNGIRRQFLVDTLMRKHWGHRGI